MISNSFDHYDAIEEWTTYQLFNEIAQDNFEFQQWLVEEGFIYFTEAEDANQSYQQWKININTQMKNTLTRFGQFSLQQLSKDMPFLQTFREVILNSKQYPPKDNLIMKNAPNYMAAINRISSPLTTHLNSIDLSNIETSGKGAKVNLQVKKSVIPSYDGKTEFKQYCKNYFYGGEANRRDLNSTQCGQLLPLAFQFCITYESRLKSLQTEIAALANYINNESSDSSVKSATQGDLKQLKKMQQKAQTPGMASNNPVANAAGQPQQVNASTDYTYFMKYYFNDILHEDGLPNPAARNPTVSGQKGVPATSNSQKDNPTVGAQVNTKALSFKKKQMIVDIVAEAFTAKITAFGMLYHDFIYLLRAHVASYKGAVHGNMGRVQNINQQPNNMQQSPQMKR